MSKRVTIVLDEDLLKKLRYRQAKEIQKTSHSASFSKIVNLELRKCLK